MTTPLSTVRDGLTEAEAALGLATLTAAGIKAAVKVSRSPFGLRGACILVPARSLAAARALLAGPPPPGPTPVAARRRATPSGLFVARGLALVGAAGSLAALACITTTSWAPGRLLLLGLPAVAYLAALVRLRASRCPACGYRLFPVLGSPAAFFGSRCAQCGHDIRG